MARIINNDAVISLKLVYSEKSRFKNILTCFGAVACSSARKYCLDNCSECQYTVGKHKKYFMNVNFGTKDYSQIRIKK